MILINTPELTETDLAVLFSKAFPTAKSAKVTLRVKIKRRKTYPQNDKSHSEGMFLSPSPKQGSA